MADINIRPVSTKADKQAFVDLPFRLYADDPNWVPPLKSDVMATITPGKNPWFEHGEAQLFLAEWKGQIVGRISAHLDFLALAQPPEQGMGPGVGNWGFFEAEDAEVAKILIETAESWLRDKKMVRALGPLSLSIWEEPGLLVQGHDHPPTILMGHHNPAYGDWIEAAGYAGVKDLYTYHIPIDVPFPPLVQRIVATGERNERIVIRKVNKANFDAEAAIILSILNDAWSGNWGFVPITDAEVAHTGKQLKPIVFNDLIRIAEVDGEPVAFMMTWPDINEKIGTFGGSLFPFNWAKLLWWLRAPKVRSMRVPLMGVVKKFQATRLASQLAFMMVTYIRDASTTKFGASRGEFGWVLDDNGPMRSVGEAMNGEINKVYRIYEKPL
ncbi:N-acetyltransferase [Sphingorhabdus sp. EL138]|uniref:N-acetyltransferase n=1 Tax=Sphingorhabdus sp. EL138 TaxID=2073156 RepID=UPI0025FA7D2D|nr:N-acetyltransferase [Sphingorhabdus sp. EL138]